MATFKSNIERMVGIIGSRRKLALRGGVVEKTIRNWLEDDDADSGSKIKSFAQRLSVPRGQLIGEHDIPEEWWDQFRESCKDELRADALAILKKTGSDEMSPEQKEALAAFVGSFKKTKAPARAS